MTQLPVEHSGAGKNRGQLVPKITMLSSTNAFGSRLMGLQGALGSTRQFAALNVVKVCSYKL